jgi:hypothetical protein
MLYLVSVGKDISIRAKQRCTTYRKERKGKKRIRRKERRGK